MDEIQAEQQHLEGGQHTPGPEANVTNQNKPNQMTKDTQITGGSSSSYYPRGKKLHHPHQQQLQRQVRNFWETQCKEIESTTDFKNALPLKRIKKIMKDDCEKMIAHEAPLLLSKACEMFIMDLTARASVNVGMRTILQKRDIVSAASMNDMFDFLIDILPRDETVKHEVCVGIPPMRGNAADVVQNIPPHPFYYMPSPPPHYFCATIPHPIFGQQPPHLSGLKAIYPAPKHLIVKNTSDSDDQNKK